MAIEVFNRYEKKYILDDCTYEKLLRRIEEYMEPDEYNKSHEFYSISNIYYDTPTDELIRNSLAKPVYKEKLRLRAYGVPGANDKVFLEIKKKYDGLVNKRRINLELMEAYDYLNKKIRPDENKEYINSQVLKEIDYFTQCYRLEPKVYIAYDRKAYFARDDHEFRLTFDSNIRTRRYDLGLEMGDYGNKLMEEGKWLMEVKISDAIPLWFTRILSELKIYQATFSKYGTEYKKNLEKNYEGEIICLNQYLQQHRMEPQLQWANQY